MKKRVIYLIMIMVILFSGCGKKNISTKEESKAADEVITIDWKKKGFKLNEVSAMDLGTTDAPFYEIRTSELSEYNPGPAFEWVNSTSTYFNNTRYAVHSYIEGGKPCFYLEEHKSDLEEATVKPLFADETELPAGYVAAVNVVSKDDIVLVFIGEPDGRTGEMSSCYIMHVDAEGKVMSKTAVTDGYRKAGILASHISKTSWWCDVNGYTYVLLEGGKIIKVFNPEGKMVMSKDYSAEMNISVTTAFHTPDGNIVFALSNLTSKKTDLFWFDEEKKAFKTLITFDDINNKQFAMQYDGTIYCSMHSRVLKWNVATGECEMLFNYLASDISYNGTLSYVEHVSVLDTGELLLYEVDKDKIRLHVLSDAPLTSDDVIRLADYCGHVFVKSAAATYTREHPGTPIDYQRGKDWVRTMAEIVAGKGPDILVMWLADGNLSALCEKGVLADLSEYIPSEIREKIYPGIIEMGTYDGKLIGICPEGMPVALITSDELWEEDTWTVNDVISTVQKNDSLETWFVTNGNTSWDTNLRFLLSNIERSPFIDKENGISYLNTKEFKDVLELCKQYSKQERVGDDDSSVLNEKKALVTQVQLLGSYLYPKMVKQYGENCHFVGYPDQKDYVGYWSNGYLIVVNNKTAYKKEIGEFLQHVLSYETQTGVSFVSVREDNMRDNVVYDEAYRKWYYRTAPGKSGGDDFTKPDGSCYIDDYIAFLKKLGGRKNADSTILSIIMEEADEFFEGNATVDKVAEIMHNRVQLYLYETRD